MEQKAENYSIISVNNAKEIIAAPDHPPPHVKKGRSSKNIFKVALFMMRGRSRKSKVLPVDEESSSIWRKLVGSMRPLHLQSSVQSPPQILPSNDGNKKKLHKTVTMASSNASDHGDDGFDSASEFLNSPSPCSSRYASAVGLNEMVQDEDSQKEEEEIFVKENENEVVDVDVKAEEFIAQFYQQMRLQRLDVVDRRYKEISMRSLGL
ncbi:hypothetical protein SESBI_28099 [Sesbania bispinosa]|nr:hypothetical protein SESBI_28099 [Sesbania bispinosa]